MPTTVLRNACITVNNYTPEKLTLIKEFMRKKCSFSVYGKEVSKQGTPHLQIYVEFIKQVSFNVVRKAFFFGHIEPREGPPKCAAGYCKKGNARHHAEDFDYSIYFDNPAHDWDGEQEGIISAQGSRTDLESMRDNINNGMAVDQIVVDHPHYYHQYGRTLNKLEDIALRKRFRTWMTTCEWFWGPTGSGKSHRAFEGYDPSTHYLWKDDNGWQDGYTGQEIVIINDFRGAIPYNELLQMIDKWPYTVNRRAREPAPFLAKHIVITSSLAPEAIYHHRLHEDSLEQLFRRITVTHLL